MDIVVPTFHIDQAAGDRTDVYCQAATAAARWTVVAAAHASAPRESLGWNEADIP